MKNPLKIIVVGASGKMGQALINEISNNNSFSHLVLGFPLTKKIGTSIGMIPFSSTGYEINIRDIENHADLKYHGDGGISKVYFGAAYKFFDGFSFGINTSYLFGGITIIQLYAQGLGVDVPSQILSMLPYLATIIVLIVISRDDSRLRLNAPACLGRNFHTSG